MSKTKQISVSKIKAKFLALFELVSAGGITVIVTKRGKPIAKIEGISQSHENESGTLRDTVISESDIVSPMGANEWLAAK